MIHFDTNFLIQALVPGTTQEANLESWLENEDALAISSIAWSEFLCGPITPQAEAVARIVFPSTEPFLGADAEKAAQLFNQTGRRSRSLADCMIAAVALRCEAKMATSNTNDFLPLEKLGLILIS